MAKVERLHPYVSPTPKVSPKGSWMILYSNFSYLCGIWILSDGDSPLFFKLGFHVSLQPISKVGCQPQHDLHSHQVPLTMFTSFKTFWAATLWMQKFQIWMKEDPSPADSEPPLQPFSFRQGFPPRPRTDPDGCSHFHHKLPF